MTSRAKVWTEFLKMRITHERLGPAHALFDDLRATNRDAPLEPKRFASIFAETHTGKSMCVCTYLETTVAEEAIRRGLFPGKMDRKDIAKKQHIVLYISLEGVTNLKNLAQEILFAMGRQGRWKHE
jgi:AAA domain